MRIFYKIFGTFWLAFIAVIIASFGVTLTLGDGTLIARWRHATGSAMAVYAQTAVTIYEMNGRDALDRYLTKVDHAADLQAYLFDDSGEVSGLDAPPSVERALGVRDTLGRHPVLSGLRGIVASIRPHAVWMTTPATGNNSKQYYLVCNGLRLVPPAGGPVIRMLAIALAAGLVCLLLARNFSGPLVELGKATRGIAEGRFSTRVASTVVERRDEIGELGRDFDRMASRLETLVTAERRLIADISHELRSPLARLGVAVGLADRTANEQTREALRRIEREAERLNEMIGQLSTLSMLQGGAIPRRREPIDVSALLTDIVDDANFEASSQNRSVKLTTLSAPLPVHGDPSLIRSALENVIRNAARYTAENTTVDVSLATSGRQTVIRVRDHGPGVPAEHLKSIFTPFFRVDSARDRKDGGVGLGLAIVDEAVRHHGGVVEARNADGGGLEVSIRLPAL